ncbi:MAG: dipeptidase PepE [Bacteroidota bacterium]|nr:dipeptidase PepE [Bacteroidota bacterium]
MKCLLISNSTMAGEPYLDYPKHNIAEFLGKEKVNALFIPYAAVSFSWDEYEEKVKTRFNEVGHDVTAIHKFDDPVKAVEEADAIVIGGGNTWNLVRVMRDNNLLDPIRKKVLDGTPYIGWSAGSNVTCPTIKTTNDMPIIDPKGFDALNLIPFQINPHFLDKKAQGHAGESREDRISEFLVLNKDMPVAGLREGCMFLIEGDKMKLIGIHSLRLFKYGKEPQELDTGQDFSFLLNG